MSNIVIRSAKTSDVETLFTWGNENQELWGSEESKWYTAEGIKRYIKELGDDLFLVAECDGELAGMCHTRYMQEWAYLENLFVEKRFRRLGIAKMLVITTLAEFKKKRGIENIGLQVRADNPGARSFYKHLGFREGFPYIWMEKDIA